jgi:hypothetical protein
MTPWLPRLIGGYTLAFALYVAVRVVADWCRSRCVARRHARTDAAWWAEFDRWETGTP